MKVAIITALVGINFCFAWALHDSWERNERLADIDDQTIAHLNEYTETLKVRLNDLQAMCEQVMEDAGMVIFREGG